MGILEEKIVFSRLKNKDREAFARAYDLYIDDIYRFIYFKVGTKEEAEDLTSAVWLKTWDHVQTNNLLEAKTLRALVYKIARNLVIDYYKKNRAENERSLDYGGSTIEVIADNDPASSVDVKMEISSVEKKLQEIKDEYREVIVLRFLDEMSIGEIADILDKSKGGVRVLLHRAITTLKKIMNEE